eukprot:CAMPEP_0202891274 /NCGR_PEP_ID=MMETSP1392-20130828/1379_1 /ASSEMBLY_ACC=CAM_ASM_000868 /TAXON_ID=225041 /ORGANISM="Chlamydomonas chlamydogama, Strain SAG 11-48b" /LENGTH=322 /DNA_ID=CAMNT_0049574977 /DNA_START=70 /DNA_END=1038 /DNA_ORIENTATION=-
MSHAPYIMPDGGTFKAERARASLSRNGKTSKGAPGKHAQADLVNLMAQRMRSSGGASTSQNSEQELAELRALEAVGVRRRRRWLNDKQLRDLAGPLSAADMAAQFNPVPFGVYRESPLQQIREDPETAAIWDSFRSIDPEKEKKVLQKWAEYNAEQRTKQQVSGSREETAAAAALKRWAAVGKPARQALRKANVHSVLALETQVLELFDEAAAADQVVIPCEDGFCRLLIHGLAQFHGLASSSLKRDPAASVSVSLPQQQRAAQERPAHPDITCTDVLLALAELGSSGLTHSGLHTFVRKHIHGVSSGAPSEADWVLVAPVQ